MDFRSLLPKASRLLNKKNGKGVAPIDPDQNTVGTKSLKKERNFIVAKLRSELDRITIYIADRLSISIYRSSLFVSPLDLASRIVTLIIITIAVAISSGVLIALDGSELPIPASVFFATAILPSSLLIVHFVSEPFFAVYARKSKCARELPFLSTYLMISAASGVSVQSSFEQLRDFKYLPQFRNESLRIEKVRRLYALNGYEAITFEGRYHPAEFVKDLYLAAVAAQREGGEVFRLLKDETAKLFSIMEVNLRTISDKFSVIASAEMVAFIMLPMGIITVGVLFSGLLGIPVLLVACFIFPAATALLLGAAIDSYIPKELTEPVPLRGLLRGLFSLPAIALLLAAALFLNLPPYFAFGGSIAAFSLPAILFYSQSRRRTREILSALPVFTRSVADEVKKGSSPKQAIANISELRSFNRSFDRLLYKVVAFLKIGFPISNAIDAVDAPWIAKVSFELLGRAELMGAEPRSLDSLSELVRGLYMNFKSLDSQTRLFTITSYLNSVILSFSVAIVVEVVAKLFTSLGAGVALVSLPIGMSFITGAQLPVVENIAYTSVVFNAFLLGLLGGKAGGGGSIVDGLKPALVCVVLSMIGIAIFKDLGVINVLTGGFGGFH